MIIVGYVAGAFLWAGALITISAAGALLLRRRPTIGEVFGMLALATLHGAIWPVSMALTLYFQIQAARDAGRP